jgi:hypothetical protein
MPRNKFRFDDRNDADVCFQLRRRRVLLTISR